MSSSASNNTAGQVSHRRYPPHPRKWYRDHMLQLCTYVGHAFLLRCAEFCNVFRCAELAICCFQQSVLWLTCSVGCPCKLTTQALGEPGFSSRLSKSLCSIPLGALQTSEDVIAVIKRDGFIGVCHTPVNSGHDVRPAALWCLSTADLLFNNISRTCPAHRSRGDANHRQ